MVCCYYYSSYYHYHSYYYYYFMIFATMITANIHIMTTSFITTVTIHPIEGMPAAPLAIATVPVDVGSSVQ